MSRPSAPLDQRIRSNVRVDGNGCWIWQRCILKSGYGCIRVSGKTRTAHSVAYETFKGPVPAGLEIDHLCRVRACCNPDHLEAVTHQLNVIRGAGPAAKAAITHCPYGHEYTPDNTYRVPGRACKTCALARSRAHKARIKQERSAA